MASLIMLRAFAIALVLVPNGAYTPVRPTPRSLVATRVRTPLCADASFASMSYRELQQACKARGIKATGKADVLRERLAEHTGDGAEPAGAAEAAPAPEAQAPPPIGDEDLGLAIAQPGPPLPEDDLLSSLGSSLGDDDTMDDSEIDDLLSALESGEGLEGIGLEGWPEEGAGRGPASTAGGVAGGETTTDWLDDLFGGADAPEPLDFLGGEGGESFSSGAQWKTAVCPA